MLMTCPSCGAEATLDVVITHEETRQLMVAILTLSLPLGALVARYLRLFKPAKQQLRPERIRKLLEALAPDIQRQHINRKGRDWWVPTETWSLGLEAVLDTHAKGRLDTPLPDHAYLYEVLMRMSDKQEAREEAKSEQGKRGERSSTTAPQPVAATLATPLHTAPPPPPAYTGPSPYARRIKAEQEARRQARLQSGVEGDSNPDGGTPI